MAKVIIEIESLSHDGWYARFGGGSARGQEFTTRSFDELQRRMREFAGAAMPGCLEPPVPPLSYEEALKPKPRRGRPPKTEDLHLSPRWGDASALME